MKQRRGAKAPESYTKRTYRGVAERSGLVSSYVSIRETDLHILAEKDVTDRAAELVIQYRLQLEGYISRRPEFASTLGPLLDDPLAPPLIKNMLSAARAASVGPMAAVAGAIAEYVCRALVDEGLKEVIVENGGDIFLTRSCDCTVAIFAGRSPLSNRVGLKLHSGDMPVGICTSSGTVGHSLSLGAADSVTVLADSAITADAAATSIGNEVRGYSDARDGIDKALKKAAEIPGLRGTVVICADLLGVEGRVELIPLE